MGAILTAAALFVRLARGADSLRADASARAIVRVLAGAVAPNALAQATAKGGEAGVAHAGHFVRRFTVAERARDEGFAAELAARFSEAGKGKLKADAGKVVDERVGELPAHLSVVLVVAAYGAHASSTTLLGAALFVALALVSARGVDASTVAAIGVGRAGGARAGGASRVAFVGRRAGG